MHPYLTIKQLELMRVITAQPETDLDEILESIRYMTTKQSLQFSIRALIKRGLVEKRGLVKRRGRVRQVLAATVDGQGYKTLPAAYDPKTSDVVDVGGAEGLDPMPPDILGM